MDAWWCFAVNIKGCIVWQHGPQHSRVDRWTFYTHSAQVCQIQFVYLSILSFNLCILLVFYTIFIIVSFDAAAYFFTYSAQNYNILLHFYVQQHVMLYAP